MGDNITLRAPLPIQKRLSGVSQERIIQGLERNTCIDDVTKQKNVKKR
jgi:hypothetical protein